MNLPYVDFSTKEVKTIQAPLDRVIEQLHQIDDPVTELIDEAARGDHDKLTVSLINDHIQKAFELCQRLKVIQCPECGGVVEFGVCQTSSCKERLL